MRKFLSVLCLLAAGIAGEGTPAASHLAMPASQDASIPYQVFDGTGKLVGQMIGTNIVAMTIKGIVVIASVSRDALTGVYSLESQVGYYYTTSTCKGQAYLNAETIPLQTFNNPVTNVNYIPRSFKTITVKSVSILYPNGAINCTSAFNAFSAYVGTPAVLDLDRLGFRPPFSVK